ncbi:MAG: pyruvate kinase [Pseudomonadales bacterium]|nr:pyruvate kinase [Pseudomonadales bacterium]
MRKTKIICTIGPASDSIEKLQQLNAKGMNIARLNMSHGDHQSHAAIIQKIRQLNQQLAFPIAILMDTQGPEIRTGQLAEDLQLHPGDEITVSVRGGSDVEESSLQIDYEDLVDQVAEGDRITVDNGLINLEVLKKNSRELSCRVIDGGIIKSKRHVNLPGIRVNLPAITEKDKRDIQFAIEHELDFIALSFVRSAEDVKALREILERKNAEMKIIAKIEDQEGVRNLSSIIRAADAIMVARGDLGVEVNIEDLPNIQRSIVRECAVEGKPVIVATHLLESMIENPIPTRAEVTDVANAVYEEVDSLMLSGETTVGKYPMKCVEYLDKVACTSERTPGLGFSAQLKPQGAKQQIAQAAVRLADDLKVKGIICITKQGKMAGFASSARIQHSPIYAFTFSEQVRLQMNLLRSVQSFCIKKHRDPELMIDDAFALMRSHELAKKGDRFVVISDVLISGEVEAIQLRTVT